MWDAKPGMKVVCIDNSTWPKNRVPYVPKLGVVYTIRAITESFFTDEGILLKLEEIPDQHVFHNATWFTVCWNKEKFRPLQTNEKGMELLRWALNNPHAPVEGFEETKRKVKELT